MTPQELLDLDSDIARRLGLKTELGASPDLPGAGVGLVYITKDTGQFRSYSPTRVWRDAGPLLDALSKHIIGLTVSWSTTAMDPPGVGRTVAIFDRDKLLLGESWGLDVKVAICRAWIAWDDAGRP